MGVRTNDRIFSNQYPFFDVRRSRVLERHAGLHPPLVDPLLQIPLHKRKLLPGINTQNLPCVLHLNRAYALPFP